MDSKPNQLWPYHKSIAFLAIPLTWIFFVIIYMIGQRYAGWERSLQGTVVWVIAALSFLPVALMTLDFFSSRNAVLDIKGFKIDFSNISLNEPGIKRESFRLPDNIGLPNQVVSDTSPMNIIQTLEAAVDYEIAVLNLRNGDSWWVTRLIALSAGAMRAGSPTVLAFIGKKDNIRNYYLGWGKPKDILEAILSDSKRPEYKIRYDRSIQISRQFLLFKSTNLIPTVQDSALPARSLNLSQDITRYLKNEYINAGDAVFEHIIMDQYANQLAPDGKGSLEQCPDKLTIHRLNELSVIAFIRIQLTLVYQMKTKLSSCLMLRHHI